MFYGYTCLTQTKRIYLEYIRVDELGEGGYSFVKQMILNDNPNFW